MYVKNKKKKDFWKYKFQSKKSETGPKNSEPSPKFTYFGLHLYSVRVRFGLEPVPTYLYGDWRMTLLKKRDLISWFRVKFTRWRFQTYHSTWIRVWVSTLERTNWVRLHSCWRNQVRLSRPKYELFRWINWNCQLNPTYT